MPDFSNAESTQHSSAPLFCADVARIQTGLSVVGALLLLVVILATRTPEVFAQEEAALPTIEDIEKAWKARESTIKTLECSWTANQFIPAKTRSAQEFPSLKNVLVPEEDLKVTPQCKLQIGIEGRYRYERDGKELVNRIQQYTDRHMIFVSDGKQAKSHYGEDKTGEQRYAPLGFIRKNEQIFEFLDLATSGAILLYCRPDAPYVAPYCSLKSAQVKGRAIANGRRCVLVEHGEESRKTQIYFDLEWDLVPVRLIRWSFDSEAGKPFELFRFDLGYEESPDGPPHLTIWKSKSSRSINQPIFYQSAVVKSFEINAAIPDSAFDLEFPAGTKVMDEANRDTYLIRNDGSKRPITLAERNALVSYKTLLNTEPQQQVPAESNQQR